MPDRSGSSSVFPPGLVAIIVMGVAGSGKTTIGILLAERLGCAFQEGDDLHSPENVARMTRGKALNDADRLLWLRRIAGRINDWRVSGQCGVITSSALKRVYRDMLICGHGDVRLVYLQGSIRLLQQRILARKGHFMPASLLESQLQILEAPMPDECAITVDVEKTPDQIVGEIINHLVDWQNCATPARTSSGEKP